MSIKTELTSGKILVISGDGKHGVISELTTKYRVQDLYDEIEKEVEDKLRAKMSENIVHYEFGMNIEFFTSSRWLVTVSEDERNKGLSKVRLALPHAGVVINDASSVYVPPYLIALDFTVDGKGLIGNKICYAFVYMPGMHLNEYFEHPKF